jgi:hypothetical protein
VADCLVEVRPPQLHLPEAASLAQRLPLHPQPLAAVSLAALLRLQPQQQLLQLAAAFSVLLRLRRLLQVGVEDFSVLLLLELLLLAREEEDCKHFYQTSSLFENINHQVSNQSAHSFSSSYHFC